MITRKIIKYEILVEYYKACGCRPGELIARKTDFCYNKDYTVELALKTVKAINSSKKRLIRAASYDGEHFCESEIFCGANIRKDVQEALNKQLEESNFVHMTFSYNDNKLVNLIINKTNHNHHYA